MSGGDRGPGGAARRLDQPRLDHVLLTAGLDRQRGEAACRPGRVGRLHHVVAGVLFEHFGDRQRVQLPLRRDLIITIISVYKPCISRAFSAAGITVRKEPAGLVQRDGKRPDCCTLIPWRGGRPLAWDVTVGTTVADSYVTAASQSAGFVAQQAADRKCQKYGELSAAVQLTSFSLWQLRHMGRWTTPRSVFSPTWVGKLLNIRVTRLMVSFYFNGSVC